MKNHPEGDFKVPFAIIGRLVSGFGNLQIRLPGGHRGKSLTLLFLVKNQDIFNNVYEHIRLKHLNTSQPRPTTTCGIRPFFYV
jgi:hypothetical protein